MAIAQRVLEDVISVRRESAALRALPDRLDLVHNGGIGFQSALLRAAAPVVEQLGADLEGTRVSVLFADDQGRIVQATGEPPLVRNGEGPAGAPSAIASAATPIKDPRTAQVLGVL